MFTTRLFSCIDRASFFSVRWYAGAVKAKATTAPLKNKAAANSAASLKKQKQTLLTRKKKSTVSTQVESPGSLTKLMTSDRSGPFRAALFTVDPDHVARYAALQADAHECYHRFVIDKAVSRWNDLEAERMAHEEQSMMQNKAWALKELHRISPTLWQMAVSAPLSMPPCHRRLPTESCPTKPPFLEDEPAKHS